VYRRPVVMLMRTYTEAICRSVVHPAIRRGGELAT
jgi:hypothetical protein